MPYKQERNHNDGEVLVSICEDIPSKRLKRHKVLKYIENISLEINLVKTK